MRRAGKTTFLHQCRADLIDEIQLIPGWEKFARRMLDTPGYERSAKANLGHALETAVFIELKRRGAEVAYVKTKSGFEIDFHARYLDGTEEFIQVCASVDDSKTLAREVRSLEDPH